MPNTNRDLSLFLSNGTPDSFVQPLVGGPGDVAGTPSVPGSFTPYAPGQVGISFELNDKVYTPVILDSGCTAATPTGLVAANQLLFWKSKANRIVTNDRRMALGASVTNASGNFVAGVARCAVPAASMGTGGALICMLVRGYGITLKAGTVSGLGQQIVADTDANGPQVLGVAVGTASTYAPVGVAESAAANSAITATVNLPTLP